MESHRVVGILVVLVFMLGCCSGFMKHPVEEQVELPSTAYVPFVYPRYMQCDPLWANDRFVFSLLFISEVTNVHLSPLLINAA